MRKAASSGASRRSCDRCGAPTLRQLVGRIAALSVTADDRPLPLADALTLTGPDRLAWCLKRSRLGVVSLAWYSPRWHRSGCVEHVVEHACLPGAPQGRRPEGATW